MKKQVMYGEQSVGETIRSQIQAIDGWALMAWGARDFIQGKLDGYHEGLKFRVSGLKFKGWVMILYKPVPDLYEIQTYKVLKGEVIYYDKAEDVYADMLVEIIDGFIER